MQKAKIRTLAKWTLTGAGAVVFVGYFLHSMGAFTSKIAPGKAEVAYLKPENLVREFTILEREVVPHHEAVGTVASQKRIVISSQISGVVAGLYCREGEKIIRESYLFNLPGEFARELDQEATENLAKVFQEKGYGFFEDSLVDTQRKGAEWMVRDYGNVRQYRIAKEANKSDLAVYQRRLLIKIADEEAKTKVEQAKNGVQMAEAALQQAIQNLSGAQANYQYAQYQENTAGKSLLQAREMLNQAEAVFKQAESNYERIKGFWEKKAATEAQYEEAQSRYLQAKSSLEQSRLGVEIAQAQQSAVQEIRKATKASMAQTELGIKAAKARLEHAEQAVREARIAIGYTEIWAPDDGVVVSKGVEPGDLAWPGKQLLAIHNPQSLQLEAEVRESLRHLIELGREFEVAVETIGYREKGKVVEIIPSADPATRTFLVKLAIAHRPGLYPGMFGTLYLPLLPQKVVLLPKEALQRVGQLELVYVKTQPDRWVRRFVTTGKRYPALQSSREDGEIEVLSGISKNEIVGLLKE